MYLWLWVTKDKYQLPIAVACSSRELAMITGRNLNTIQSSVSRWESGKLKKSSYVRVWVDKEDDE